MNIKILIKLTNTLFQALTCFRASSSVQSLRSHPSKHFHDTPSIA